MTRLQLKVTSGSRRTALERLPDGSLRIHVRERAVDGKANRAVIELLAARLDVPESCLTILRGANGRHKILCVDILDAEAVLARLAPAAAVKPAVSEGR